MTALPIWHTSRTAVPIIKNQSVYKLTAKISFHRFYKLENQSEDRFSNLSHRCGGEFARLALAWRAGGFIRPCGCVMNGAFIVAGHSFKANLKRPIHTCIVKTQKILFKHIVRTRFFHRGLALSYVGFLLPFKGLPLKKSCVDGLARFKALPKHRAANNQNGAEHLQRQHPFLQDDGGERNGG